MADFKSSQKTAPALMPRRNDTADMVLKSPTGRLQIVSTSQKTSNDLQQAWASGQMDKVKAYFDAVFSSDDEQVIDANLQRFLKRHNITKCFYCEDSGLHNVEMDAPNGKTYQFGFSCVCEEASKGTAPILDLSNQGYFKLACQLGGADGSTCPLKAKDVKCLSFYCPKFPTERNY